MKLAPPVRQYAIRSVLGRGGFGTVYAADLVGAGGFSKPVAIKLLHAEVETPDGLARLRDEARMLGFLNHRAIVRVDGLVKLDGCWAIVMEQVPGVTLAELVGRPVPVGAVLQIGEELAAALHEAWTREVHGRPLRLLHRDIKPHNIKLTPDGTVKLLDFGVARANFGSREAKTRASVFGSLPYMPPERLTRRDNDRSDVFALAVSLGELLAGRLDTKPSGTREGHEARVQRILQQVGRAVPSPELTQLLGQCLAFNADERPTAQALGRELRSLRRLFPDVHLSDWAADQTYLPAPEEPDDRVGQTYEEEPDGESVGKIPDTFLLHPTSEFERIPTPPPAGPARSPAAGCLGGLMGATLAAAGLLFGAVVLGLGATGLGLLVLVALVWDEALLDAQHGQIEEMHGLLETTRPGPGRVASTQALDDLREGLLRGRVSLIESTLVLTRVQSVTRDGVVSDNEAKEVRRLVQDALGATR